jgi:hypothetical protein
MMNEMKLKKKSSKNRARQRVLFENREIFIRLDDHENEKDCLICD